MLTPSKHKGHTMLTGMFALALALVPLCPFQPAVRVAALDIQAQTNAVTPTVGVIQAVQPVVPEVDRLDQMAHAAQTRLFAVWDSGSLEAFADALRTYIAAEDDLEVALEHAWGAMLDTRTSALLINEPLILAMLTLHIEVRRALGPRFATVVPGLTTDRGCQGDIVGERLLYAYGAAAASPFGAQSDQTLAALAAMARQVVCLGAGQLAAFETAVVDGFQAVSERMTQQNLAAVMPAFVRHLAPVQVLILDARKHRGNAARAWQWFAAYGELLQDDVARAGWATEALLVWDRRRGVLVGFRNCAQGHRGPDCVDFERFLDSIRDPRALGLGDCALAAMLSMGSTMLGGEERYACPPSTCEAPLSTPCSSSLGSAAATVGNCGTSGATIGTQGGTRLAADERSRLRSTWSQLQESDLDQMEGLCRGAHTDLQGVHFNLDACFAELSHGNTNPFDTYAACMVEAVGGGAPPHIGSQLQGVPTGIKCGLADAAGAGTPQNPQPDNQQNSQPNNQQPNNQPNNQENNKDNANNQQNQKPPARGADPHLGITSPHRHHAPVSVTDRLGQEAKSKQFFETAKELIKQLDAEAKQDPRVHQPKGPGSDCVDPGACSNDCTGLGQQISAVSACTEDLLGALTQALGLPDKKDLTRKLDIVSYPNPEAETGGDDLGISACLGGNNDPSRQPVACGLILCADGFLAMGVGESCSCGQTAPGFMPQKDLCLMVRCADGHLPGPDCTCQPVETSAPQPLPEPGPLPDLTSPSDMRPGIAP